MGIQRPTIICGESRRTSTKRFGWCDEDEGTVDSIRPPLKSPERLIEQMRSIKDSYGINTFDLIHDMFTVDRKRVADFCEALLRSNDEFNWNCSARTDCVDDDLIALMAKAGCRGIFFGIETGSARLQKTINKGLDLAEAELMIKSTNKRRITTAVSLIYGFPEETMEDVRDTVGFLIDSLRYLK